jgi:hypothetical protein
MSEYTKDVFLCHPGKDKERVVRPLAHKLEAAGISCWLDEAELRWGDSIVSKVNEGLASSRFVIVVLSPSFVYKHWPQRELNSALHEEAGSGQVRVLPLLTGEAEQRNEILDQFPLLHDKRYLAWDGSGENVLEELQSWLSKPASGQKQTQQQSGPEIPIPKVRRYATDQEKEQFLRQTFDTIKDYFQKGLQELEQKLPETSTDFDEISRYKFTVRIYHQGNERCKCKIWRGGVGSDGIAFAEGFSALDQDNAFSEQITIEDSGYGLGLKMLMGSAFGTQPRDRVLNQQEAAEALWLRFVQRLEQ